MFRVVGVVVLYEGENLGKQNCEKMALEAYENVSHALLHGCQPCSSGTSGTKAH